ncbi:MAG: HPr family phosphocarrier protein [Ruminiclostridium sp.]
MKQVKINIGTINDVKEFISIVNKETFEADIAVGKYVVDAKSIMGIFSLDLSKPLNLTVHSDDCDEFLDEISKFIVK